MVLPISDAVRSPREQEKLGVLTTLLAVSCGLAVANLYYSQPLLSALAEAFGTTEAATATVVTITQIGYATGLLLLLPIGDLVETRKLVPPLLVVVAASLCLAGLAPSLGVFLAASAIIGLASVVTQVLVPFAAHLAPDAKRGRVVGKISSGLLAGLLLSRSVSGLVAGALGWQAIFFISAAAMLVLALVLARALPGRPPDHTAGYRKLMSSTLEIVRAEPLLRRLALSQALMFAAYSAFWTAIAFELIDGHGFDLAGVGLFALIAAVGVFVAPFAGRIADQGRGMAVSGAVMSLGFLAAIVAGLGAEHLVVLAIAAVVLDVSVVGNQVLNLREVYELRADARSRINAAYMSAVFVGGAVGSVASGLLYDQFGWGGVMALAALAIAIAVAVWAWSRRSL